MKKILTILLLLSAATSLSAQHYIGVRGGWGGGSGRFLPVRETTMQWGLYSGGFSYKFFSPEKYIGAVQIDAQFAQRGFAYDDRLDSDTSYHRTINSVEIPIMWQPHIYLFNRNGRFFLNLGVYFNYNFTSKDWLYSRQNGILQSGGYNFQRSRDNQLGYGLCAGAGVSLMFNRIEVTMEGRYYYGYSDILRNRTQYRYNPLRSPIDNLNISVGVYYRLGKGGIRSTPTAAMSQKMEESAAKKASKRENEQQKAIANE